ncbi:MAG TPA: chromate resistance protein ChrB domain-containing protein [Burkholderiales bacterium]|nr:chromate resistance protein ChrB domain-containing protein [Burkholderiales bacterium]
MARPNAPFSEPGASPPATRWLAFVTQLPIDDATGRMKVLRTLETLGCAVLRDGVYLLPDSIHSRGGLAKLAEYVERISGSGYILAVRSVDEAQSKQFRGLFDRSAQYRDLIKTIESLEAGFGISDPAAIRRVLGKQRRDLEAISALDFFSSPLKVQAENALAAMEAKVRDLMFPEGSSASPAAGVARADRNYFQRAWATRKPLFTDRLASAWLIRRFIDPEATLIWLEKTAASPATAVTFGFDGATFRNSKHHVTFQELLASFKLDRNAALVKIGKLVHALEAGGSRLAEAAGVETLLAGAKRRATTEDELLAETEKTFDLLYEAYFEQPAKA